VLPESPAPEHELQTAPPRLSPQAKLFGGIAFATAVALFVVSQQFSHPHKRVDYSTYKGATAVTLPGGPGAAAASTTTTAYVAPTTAVPARTVPKFYADDARLRASFPTAPERLSQDLNVAGVVLKQTMYYVDQPDVAYFAGSVLLPADVPVDLIATVDASTAAVGGRTVSTRTTTFQGFPAVERVMTVTDGTMREMAIRGPHRVYFIIVGGTIDDVARYERFRDAVEIIP
jgi:hypothetical protein